MVRPSCCPTHHECEGFGTHQQLIKSPSNQTIVAVLVNIVTMARRCRGRVTLPKQKDRTQAKDKGYSEMTGKETVDTPVMPAVITCPGKTGPTPEELRDIDGKTYQAPSRAIIHNSQAM